MSTNTLNDRNTGDTITKEFFNDVHSAIKTDFVGRNSSGAPEAGQNLGTLALPWGAGYFSSIILNGSTLDTSQITSAPNRIVSGATRSLSSMPDFISASGSATSFDILGATTNIILSINSSAVTVNTDITKTGVSTAPAANNTALVNDATMSNDLYAGEDGTVITIGTVGSEISALIGQIIALKTATGEIMRGYLKDATTLTDVYRGFYFDSSNSPLVRGNLSNGDTLTLMKIGWVFIENDGLTVDVSYTTPVVSYVAPTSPVAGDYWFDISNQLWKRYSGTAWVSINRILIGEVVSDATNTIASRCMDFSNSFSGENNIEVEISSTEIIKSTELSTRVNVYGTDVVQDLNFLNWNITTDLEAGLTEAASTAYYLYVNSNGQRIISDKKPYNRPDLNGYYHPYHSYRCVGWTYNDASSNITLSDYLRFNNSRKSIRTHIDVFASGYIVSRAATTAYKTIPLDSISDPVDFLSIASNQARLAQGKYYVSYNVGGYNNPQFISTDIYDVDAAAALKEFIYVTYSNSGSTITFNTIESTIDIKEGSGLIEFRSKSSVAAGDERVSRITLEKIG